jgi:hypothetical protein
MVLDQAQANYQPVFILFFIIFLFGGVGLKSHLGPFAGPLGSYKSQYCGHTLAWISVMRQTKLKVRCVETLRNVPEDMLENAMQNFQERFQLCVQQEGRHLTDIIFRT